MNTNCDLNKTAASQICDNGLPSEILAMKGIFILFWKLEECLDTTDFTPLMTKQEQHLLVHLDTPKRMGVLAKEMASLPSTITGAADNLEKKNFLERQRDPDDRRAWLLSLTQSGMETRSKMLTQGAEMFREISGLSADETERFAELATKARTTILQHGIPEGMMK